MCIRDREEEGGALLEESGGSGAEELGWKLDEDEELLEEDCLLYTSRCV